MSLANKRFCQVQSVPWPLRLALLIHRCIYNGSNESEDQLHSLPSILPIREAE